MLNKTKHISITLFMAAALATASAVAYGQGKKATTAPQSSATGIREMEKQKQTAESEIKKTKAELGENEKKVNQGLSALRKIDGDIAVSQQEIDRAQGQLRSINEKITSLEGSITSGEKELSSLRAEYLEAVKKMRVARKKSSGLAFLFASKNFYEARRRLTYMKEFSEWKDKKSAEILQKVGTLKDQKAQLVQAQNDASLALKREMAAREKLTAQRQEQQVAVSTLRENSDELRAKLARRQAEAKKLSNQISALIAEERAREARQAEERRKAEEARRIAAEKAAAEKAAAEKKAAEEKERQLAMQKKANEEKKTEEAAPAKKTASTETATSKRGSGEYAEARKRRPRTGNGSTASTETKKTSTPAPTAEAKKQVSTQSSAQPSTASLSGFEGAKGRLPKPVGGSFKIVSPFGLHPISPELPDIMDENLGIDAHVANGASACAVYEGDVIKIYDRTNTPGFRNIVVVKHGDYITVYANLETLAVKSGQHVKQGQSLGTVGTDFDDPSYGLIHFEVWKNQTHLNPSEWIKG